MKNSIRLALCGVALLLVVGGFVSFAAIHRGAHGTIAPAVPQQCAATTADETPSEQAPVSSDMTPISSCTGLVCQVDADCQECCTEDGWTLWHCATNTNPHKCICGR